MSHYSFGLDVEEDAIPDIHPDGQSAIQTRCIYPNGLPGEKPADCQRLKRSLAEPLLLAVDRQPVLGGKIIERGEGDDIIRPRE
jgi:hypothetical protein